MLAATAAFLGFFGGTFVKSALDHARDKNKWSAERRQLARELLAELSHITGQLIRFENKYSLARAAIPETVKGGAPWEGIDQLTTNHTPIFESSIGRLGALGSDTSSLVVDVFYSIRDIRTSPSMAHGNLGNLENEHPRMVKTLFHQAFIRLKPKIAKLNKVLSDIASTEMETVEQLKERMVQEDTEAGKEFSDALLGTAMSIVNTPEEKEHLLEQLRKLRDKHK